MNTCPKVLFVSPFPPPHGGVANHAQILYDSSLKDQFEVSRLNLSLPDELTENISQKKQANWRKGFLGLSRLVALLRREKPNLVYFEVSGDMSCVREMVYMCAVRLFSKARIVMHFHGILNSYNRSFPFIASQKRRLLNRVLINALFRVPNRSVFLSPVIRDAFQQILTKRNFDKSTVIENFVDVLSFSDGIPQPRGVKHVLFMGRLSREKGFFDVLEIIPSVVELYPDVTFHVCGAAETADALLQVQSQIDRLVERGHLQVHGVVSGDAKKEIFASSELLLFPTHNEIFPLVVLEGLAQGLPIITTQVGVISSIIENGVNGCLVEVGSTSSLLSTLLDLLSNQSLRQDMSIANRKKAEARFDTSVAVSSLSAIFHEELA